MNRKDLDWEPAKHVGETATVKDGVHGFYQSGKGNIFLNMGGKYPNQAVTAWIPLASAAQFSNPQQYEGKTMAVSSKLLCTEASQMVWLVQRMSLKKGQGQPAYCGLTRVCCPGPNPVRI